MHKLPMSKIWSWIYVTDPHSHSPMERLALSTIYPCFVVRFGHSLQFCYLEFDKEAINDGERSEIGRYRFQGVLNFK